jgi:hypothetical protein
MLIEIKGMTRPECTGEVGHNMRTLAVGMDVGTKVGGPTRKPETM